MPMRDPPPRRPWAAVGAAAIAIGVLFLVTTGPCSAIFAVSYLIQGVSSLFGGKRWPTESSNELVEYWLLITGAGICLTAVGVWLRNRA